MAEPIKEPAAVVLTREQQAMRAALAGVETPDVLLAGAREYAEEGRASHVAWLEHLTANGCECCTPEVVETAGDAAVQREWVRKYDVILLALDLVDETCTTRLVDAIARIADEEERKSRVKNARHALRYREEARCGARSTSTSTPRATTSATGASMQRDDAARDSLRPREGEALTTGPSSRLDSPESEASGHVAGGRRVKGRARGAAPVGSAASRLRQLLEESQGGGYTSWVDQYGKEVVGLDTHQCLVDDHAEMGRLVLDLLEGEE